MKEMRTAMEAAAPDGVFIFNMGHHIHLQYDRTETGEVAAARCMVNVYNMCVCVVQRIPALCDGGRHAIQPGAF